ncbi:hypothetical protein K227x_08500 [Rubripirellula lacrimiformis]|uniref:IncA protein n=1 Tax=Rubripirellula lacrimiformis TaxID=1930273 RepID=A0A517N5S7_9BACT|nr:hypothetical protein [Rubripirellula lacrimiformis]QDT02473.1 hypothetical protein K227x_08500 [Rubripirellula lacrimiformis]
MSRRKRASLSPSLFPFLAVLVCTLGTLILLLALVSQDATENAKIQAQSATPKPPVAQQPPQPQRLAAATASKLIAEEAFRVQQLVAFRDKQTADLESRRDQMGHLDNHIGRIQTELKRLSDEVEMAAGNAPIESIDESTLVSYRTKIEEERKTIESIKEDSDGSAPRIVIVPHKGPNGTDRRPIYLECTADGLTIWPEGTRITTQQLLDSDKQANPLDAGLRVVRHHAMQTYGDTTPPYPLLVVRPDGIDSYGAARSAMQDWDDQFGYELIPDGVKLAHATADSNLKQELETTVARAVARQNVMQFARGGQGFGGRGYGGQSLAGQSLGGQGSSGSGLPASRPRVLSAASLDRAGRSNGYHTDRGSEDFGSSTYGRSSSTRSDILGDRQSSSPGNIGSGNIGSGTNGSGNIASGGNTSYGNPGSNPNGISPETENRWANDMKSAASEIHSSGGGFGPGNLDDTINELTLDGPRSGSGSSAGSSQSMSADGSGPDAGDANDGSHDAAGTRETGSAGSSEGTLGDGSEGSAGQSGSKSGQQGSSASKSNVSAGTTGQGGAQSSGSPSSQSQGSASSQSSESSQSQGAPQMQMDLSPQRELVRPSGRNWALPEDVAGAKGNAIVRTIRIQCYEDRFVLQAPSDGGATEMFGVSDSDMQRATLELATSVRDRVARWGVALPGGRWQPRLDVEVMPGGDQRFYQLRSLMDGSGVEISGRSAQ